jgi:hypothetical protein
MTPELKAQDGQAVGSSELLATSMYRKWLGEIRSLMLEIQSDSWNLPPQCNRIVNDTERIMTILDALGIKDAKPVRGLPANKHHD